MKPPPFRYHRAASLPDALAVLAAAPESKLLAGGQSLMPMLNFRLLRPSVLIDLNRVPELGGIAPIPGGLRIGALTRHAEVERAPVMAARWPLLAHAMTHVAHATIRNRGTVGGSLCHADPAAEWPMLLLLAGAALSIASPRGDRTCTVAAFLSGALTTTLAADEILTAVTLADLAPGTGWGFAEVARRHGDFALAAAAITLRRTNGVVADARIALAGVAECALRVPAAEAALAGRTPDTALADAVAAVRAAVSPPRDLHASGAYRRHLAGVVVERALRDAWNRAQPS